MRLSLWLESLREWQILGYSSQGARELDEIQAIATTDSQQINIQTSGPDKSHSEIIHDGYFARNSNSPGSVSG